MTDQLTPAQKRMMERGAELPVALIVPAGMGGAVTTSATFGAAPSEVVAFNFKHLSPKKEAFAMEIVSQIVPELWRVISNEVNRGILPVLNNTSDWVNHTSVDSDDIMKSYSKMAIDKITEPDEESTSVDVLGDGLVRMLN